MIQFTLLTIALIISEPRHVTLKNISFDRAETGYNCKHHFRWQSCHSEKFDLCLDGIKSCTFALTISEHSRVTMINMNCAMIDNMRLGIALIISDRKYFSPIGQEYPFLQVSETFLSRPAISA